MANPDFGRLALEAGAPLGEHLKKKIREETSCDVCKDFYSAPVILRCGSSFCWACAAALSPAVCPDCGVDFDPGRLTANQTLTRLVGVAKQVLEQEERREAAALEAAGGGDARREDETFYCKQEKALICKGGYEPEEHRGHDVVPADLAAQEYRSHIQKCLTLLKREEKDFLLNKTTLEIEYEFYMRRTTQMLEKTKTRFQMMEEFLESQKREQLVEALGVYKKIRMNKNSQLSALSQKMSSLQEVMYEMEEATQLPGCELLENIGDILQKFEDRETVQPRGSLSVDLRKKISILMDFNLLLQGSMKRFREKVESRQNRHRGITAQNPNKNDPSVSTSDDPSLSTSDEPQSVTNSDQPQPSNPESSSLQNGVSVEALSLD